MTRDELVRWVHDHAAINSSMGTAAEIVEKVVEWTQITETRRDNP